MVYSIGVQNQNISRYKAISFGKAEEEKGKNSCESHDALMYDEMKKRPITTTLKIQGNKFKCAELDIGKNSVNPCTIPKIIACIIDILFSFYLTINIIQCIFYKFS